MRTIGRKCVQRALNITEQETATVRQKMDSKCLPSDRNPAQEEHRKHKMLTVRPKSDRKQRPSDRKEAIGLNRSRREAEVGKTPRVPSL